MGEDNVNDAIPSKKESRLWKTGDLVAKLLIPILIGCLGYYQGFIAEKNQKAESEDTATRQDKVDATQADLKMLELVVPFIADKDNSRKQFGLSLVKALRPELAARMYAVVQSDRQASPETRQQAESGLIVSRAQVLLKGYTVDIFVLDSDNDNQLTANKLKNFMDATIGGTVQLKVKQRSFFSSVAIPNQNEVRFNGARQPAAEALAAALNNWDTSLKFVTRETVSEYTNYLTVFLWKN